MSIKIKKKETKEVLDVVEDLEALMSFLTQIPESTFLEAELSPGIYQGPLEIRRNHLSIKGMGLQPEDTVITGNRGAFDLLDGGEKRGTFRSFTFFLDGSDCKLENLTIENRAGQGDVAGQAIALYAEGDGILVQNCRILGHQDTLFTGPLPPQEIIPGGFRGPKQFAPRINGVQTYRDCYICGTIDFIFGSATAYFEHCHIHSLDCATSGFVTAASTAQGDSVGYVFDHCQFTGDGKEHSVYLGRPWRDYGKVLIKNSYLGSHIKECGWDDWGKTKAHGSFRFVEQENKGPGAKGMRPDWVEVI